MTTSTRKTLEGIAEVLDRAVREDTARDDEVARQTAQSLYADINDRIAYSYAVLKNLPAHEVAPQVQENVDKAIAELRDCLTRIQSVRTAQDLTPELVSHVTARMAALSRQLLGVAKKAG